jgi:hypothetical protein
MIYFDPNAKETEYHDITIDDPALTEYGFTKFSLPLDDNASRMVVYNDKDPSLITYPEFDKHDLNKSVKLLYNKLVDEQQVQSKAGKDTLEGLVAYARNAFILLQEDPDNDFFKNVNGNVNVNGKTRSKSKSRTNKLGNWLFSNR